MRLDNYLFQNGFAQSRNKAQELIKSLQVLVDGKIISKPNFNMEESFKLEILNEKQYVSRAGYKLKTYLLEQDKININGKTCLDVGSSTGGFVQVLLEESAKKVVAVDVGSEQLHESLRKNSNLEIYEKTDIRNFNYNNKFEIITCDVSFIEVEQIIDNIDKFAEEYILILFKPQFEVGNFVKRDKRGVVKDQFAIKKAKDRFVAHCVQRWDLIDSCDSSVKGKEGNVETFYCFKKR